MSDRCDDEVFKNGIPKRVADEETAGVNAIIKLQACAGITETEAQARAGWRSMGAANQRRTMAAYRAIFGGS